MNSFFSKGVIQDRRRDKEFPRQAKYKGVHDHLTNPVRNFKRDSSSGGKKETKSNKDQKGPEKVTGNTNSTGNTKAVSSYLSIITLNADRLKAPIKRQRVSEWLKKQDLGCLDGSGVEPLPLTPGVILESGIESHSVLVVGSMLLSLPNFLPLSLSLSLSCSQI